MIKKEFTQDEYRNLQILLLHSKFLSEGQDGIYIKCLEITEGDDADFVFDAVYNNFDVDRLIENLKSNENDLL